jgi:hypothetical protein
VCSSLGNFDLVVDGAKCSRILTHQPVNQNCTSNLNPRSLDISIGAVSIGAPLAIQRVAALDCFPLRSLP